MNQSNENLVPDPSEGFDVESWPTWTAEPPNRLMMALAAIGAIIVLAVVPLGALVAFLLLT